MREEIKNQATELADEETEKAAGGMGIAIEQCSACGKIYPYKPSERRSNKIPKCPQCGHDPNNPG